MASPPVPWWSTKAFHLGSTHFLIDIIDLSKNILRSFVNIYTDDTNKYEGTFKTLVDHSLATEWWHLAGYIQYLENRTSYVQSDLDLQSITMYECLLWVTLERLFCPKLTADLQSYMYNSSPKIQEKMGISLYRSSKYLTAHAIVYLLEELSQAENGVVLSYLGESCQVFIVQSRQRSKASPSYFR